MAAFIKFSEELHLTDPIYGSHLGLLQISKPTLQVSEGEILLELPLRQWIDSLTIRQVRIDTSEPTDEMSFAKIGLLPIFKV